MSLRLSQLKTVYFAHDPGAAELIGYLFSQSDNRNSLLLGLGYAHDIYRKLGLKFEQLNSNQEVLIWLENRKKTVKHIISGTSQSDDADCSLWKKAFELGISVEVHVDHWMHLLQRFSHLGSILFPDQVFVTDSKSMNLLIDAGFCKDNIQVGGQPVFESKVKIITNLREDSTNKATIFKKLGLKKNSKMNVFISENMIELGLSEKYGFNELDSFLEYSCELGGALTVVKVHPKESKDKWINFIDRKKVSQCIIVCNEIEPEPLIAAADNVGGIYSTLLLQAHQAGIPCTSYQPGLKIENTMKNSFVSGIRCVI